MKTVHYGLDFFVHLGPKIWELLPNHLKRLESLEAFKSKIKSWIHGWIPGNCPCRNFKP